MDKLMTSAPAARELRKDIMYLQLFADPNTQTTLSDGLAAENKTFYEKDLIELAEPKLIHDQFGTKYPIPKNGGKTIEFRRYDSLPIPKEPLTEGVTPDGNTLNVSTITSTVQQYGDYITLSDVLNMTAIDNNVIQATKILGSQAGIKLDCITRDVLAGGTNVMYAGDKTLRSDLTVNDTLTVEIFFRAAAQLKAVNTPEIEGGGYVAIIHPYAAYDLKRDPEWIDVHKYADTENIFQGEIGKLAGIRFVEATQAKVWKSDEDNCPAGLGVFSTLVLGADAYGVTEVEGGGLQIIVKQLGAGDDPLNQRSTVGWKAIKTAERLIEQYMIRIESCSKYSSMVTAN